MAPLPGAHDMSGTAKKAASKPRPSASVILVSPSNKILLLHRTQTTTAFPSAHVFPGGNLSPSDGPVPEGETDPQRHADSLSYRTGAIRELFEESGILLARSSPTAGGLMQVSASSRISGRKAIHSNKTPFSEWLSAQTNGKGVLDTENLIPFTRWITPPNVPRRYTTQMYIYFVPLAERGNESIAPTADDLETMNAEWDTARNWLERSRRGEIILFPPQFILLYLVSEFLDGNIPLSPPPLPRSSTDSSSHPSAPTPTESDLSPTESALLTRRARLTHFITHDSTPPWTSKIISPVAMGLHDASGRQMLALDKPGPELKDSGARGEMERVVLVKFRKEGPREVEVGLRTEVLQSRREGTKI